MASHGQTHSQQSWKHHVADQKLTRKMGKKHRLQMLFVHGKPIASDYPTLSINLTNIVEEMRAINTQSYLKGFIDKALP